MEALEDTAITDRVSRWDIGATKTRKITTMGVITHRDMIRDRNIGPGQNRADPDGVGMKTPARQQNPEG